MLELPVNQPPPPPPPPPPVPVPLFLQPTAASDATHTNASLFMKCLIPFESLCPSEGVSGEMSHSDLRPPGTPWFQVPAYSGARAGSTRAVPPHSSRTPGKV